MDVYFDILLPILMYVRYKLASNNIYLYFG